MTQEQDLHPLKTRIGDFIAGLKALEKEPITTARVSDFVADMLPSADALAPYVLWSRERYTRNLIYRDSWFELLALCWLPGQRTPIHSHNGQLGWLTVVQGELCCCNYRFVRSDRDENKATPRSGYDAISVRPVEVERLDSATFEADRRVAVVDRQQTTHQIENLEKSRYGSVSLHIYSKPIDSCVLFDEASRCCERRRLQYYSEHGVVLENVPLREQSLTNAAA